MMREQFDRNLTRWHSILQALPEHGTARVMALMCACDQVATYVADGLDRSEAVNDLEQLASSHGLNDKPVVDWIIARALDE
jgi:hypothetical protein